jgi:hypothetical protein
VTVSAAGRRAPLHDGHVVAMVDLLEGGGALVGRRHLRRRERPEGQEDDDQAGDRESAHQPSATCWRSACSRA